MEDKERTNPNRETTVKLTLICETEGAKLYVDGEHVGTHDYVGSVSAGKHTMSARKEGYEAVVFTFDADGGEILNCIFPKLLPCLSPDTINGHTYVDLGLSVKWATCNVGASSPSDYGDYFAWGETTTKSTYTIDNSKTFGKDTYNHDIGGDPSLDAARANWGGTWRLPTAEECKELFDNCTWTWTTQGGKNGYRVTSNKNGKYIFLPAAGWRRGSSLGNAGVAGFYWGSSPDGSDSSNARYLFFVNSDHYNYLFIRSTGFPVRPVSE